MLKSISLCLTLSLAALAAPVSAMAPASAIQAAHPTTANTIKELLADPATAAILEKYLPGISTHPALPQFENQTLTQVIPMSQGNVTPEKIAAIAADIAALPAG